VSEAEHNLEHLLSKVDPPSRYALVIVAAKRARQINRHFLADDERQFDEYPPPLVETGQGSEVPNVLSVAFDEIGQDKLVVRQPAPARAIDDAPDAPALEADAGADGDGAGPAAE
jgi:DNA-directed RNA polymerase omega subunit